ncbi:MAG: RidA family protein [Hyphomicrobiaceae bacterium]
MSDSCEDRLRALGLELPSAPTPLANYVPALLSGDLLFVSGQISRKTDGTLIAGTLGADLTTSEGQSAARECALAILAQAKTALGSLEKIERVVKLTGFVASTPDFREQPQVINGASDLFVAVLGDNGRHTRAAVGAASLPAGAAVEIEAILKVRS